MAKEIFIDNWAVGLIPELGKQGRIVALLGYQSDGKFTESDRIISIDEKALIATDITGLRYNLGEPDPIKTPDGHTQGIPYLQAALKKYGVNHVQTSSSSSK